MVQHINLMLGGSGLVPNAILDRPKINTASASLSVSVPSPNTPDHRDRIVKGAWELVSERFNGVAVWRDVPALPKNVEDDRARCEWLEERIFVMRDPNNGYSVRARAEQASSSQVYYTLEDGVEVCHHTYRVHEPGDGPERTQRSGHPIPIWYPWGENETRYAQLFVSMWFVVPRKSVTATFVSGHPGAAASAEDAASP